MKTTLKKPVAIIGYSGHAYVIVDILLNAGRLVDGCAAGNDDQAFTDLGIVYGVS